MIRGTMVFGLIQIGESEAIGEGVEGEPQATLGGRPGSPRMGQWCRFCGSTDYPASDSCVPCSMRRFSTSMEVGQIVSDRIARQITSAFEVIAALPSVV